MKSGIFFFLFFHIVIAVVGQDANPRRTIDTVFVQKGFRVILADTSFITPRDTIIIGRKVKVTEDPISKSESFYDSLARRAEKKRLTKELHELLIRKKSRGPVIDSVMIKSEDSFKPYEGAVIRKITIHQVDLLEGTVLDTALKATSRVGRFVNRLHADTRDFVIRNNLLFKSGDRVNPYQLADNERLLRQFRTIRDARIYLSPAVDAPGAVDILVVTQDVASVGASGRFASFGNFNFDIYDINILGYAKQLQLSFFRNDKGSPVNGYEFSLREPNFGGSFIQGTVVHTDNFLRKRTQLSVWRDFLTPSMKYAGGAEYFRTSENYVLSRNDTVPQPYTRQNIDLWLSRSIQLKERTNFILSGRYIDSSFPNRPFIASDSNYFFFDRKTYLGGITLFHTNYVKGSLIQGFGKTEDVPVNAFAGITAGTEQHEFARRDYFDIRAGAARYFEHTGYFNLEATMGGFYTGGTWEDALFDARQMYFSDLIRVGKTRVRQFVNVAYTKGYNRTVYPFVGIDGSWKDGYGFVPLGKEKLSVALETVYFTPWYHYGFKFALYHGLDLNFLTNDPTLFHRNNVFPAVRGGIRVLNDNLVFPQFSIDMSYFIKTPMFKPSFAIQVSTTLPRIFGSPQNFRPEVAQFR
jgi:hypothetical protein